jgi:hypothetical protein
MRVTDIPKANTPPGGYGTDMPPPILAGCDEPLVAGAPDLRGTGKLVSIEWSEGVEPNERMNDHLERIEQAGNRLCVTSSGVIHDMYVDGTAESGVNDVTPQGMPISVVATYEDGVHVLRPVGMPGIEVTRRLDGAGHMIWTRPDGGGLVVTLERIGDGAGTPPNPFVPPKLA